jgi:hypothetical protein
MGTQNGTKIIKRSSFENILKKEEKWERPGLLFDTGVDKHISTNAFEKSLRNQSRKSTEMLANRLPK